MDHEAPTPIDAAFLRGEARFLLLAGAMTMGVGVALACGISLFHVWTKAGPISVSVLMVGMGPILMGWSGMSYAAWRFEQAAALHAAQPAPRLRLRQAWQAARAPALETAAAAQWALARLHQAVSARTIWQ